MTDKTFEPLEIILKKQGRVQEDIDKIKETFEYAYSKRVSTNIKKDEQT